ncbi:MAG: DHA2 family efflux MFS transporter permease subunit [Alphaproteobacteria bacterium]|nr:DHA2 family efflux MFS transporter permease subunit [Alphaproteobacteria bacterium]
MNGQSVSLNKVKHQGMLTLTVMIATVMQVLDSTIANVALPHMQGNLGATQDQITWILTSYILSSAIGMTLAGFLSMRFGKRQLFLISIFGFTVSSMLCGIADSLNTLVLYRLFQGLFGASFVPLSQSILLDIYPKEKHGYALALWGMGIMVGPIMGPVVGGYLTDAYSWRWVFFVNVPIGILAFTGIYLLLDKIKSIEKMPFDWKGFILIAIFLSCLQIALDRGEQLDWFDSLEIRVEFSISILSLGLFISHIVKKENPYLRLDLFMDRNFAICLILSFVVGAILQSPLALMPDFLQDLMNYPVLMAGLITAPRGVGTMISMFLVGRLIGKIETRFLVLIGLLILSYSLHQMTQFNLLMGYGPIIRSGVIMGFGLGFIFVPLSALAFSTLMPAYRTEGSGLYNLIRNIGGSIGISLSTNFLVRKTQMFHATLGEFISPYNKTFLLSGVSNPSQYKQQDFLVWNNKVTQEATTLAYLNTFKAIMFFALVSMFLLLFVKKQNSLSQETKPNMRDLD